MTDPSFIRPNELWRTVGLRAAQAVAHLGSGAGYFIIPAARIVGGSGQAYALEIRPDMLAEVASRAKREGVEDIIRTVRTNLEQEPGSPLEADSMDWVLVANILHQADPHQILKEATRLIKPAGSIIVIEWDVADSPLGPPNEARLAKPDLITILDQLNLHVTKEIKPSPYHYGLLVSK